MPSIKYKEKTYAGASFPCLEVTKAEYDALSEEKKMDGTVYMISDGTGGWEAERSTYDNTVSGLTATNVQDALDELNSKDISNLFRIDRRAIVEENNPLPGNTQKTYTGTNISIPGYKPLMFSYIGGAWCSFLIVNFENMSISGNTIVPSVIYVNNNTPTEIPSFKLIIESLWIKIP